MTYLVSKHRVFTVIISMAFPPKNRYSNDQVMNPTYPESNVNNSLPFTNARLNQCITETSPQKDEDNDIPNYQRPLMNNTTMIMQNQKY